MPPLQSHQSPSQLTSLLIWTPSPPPTKRSDSIKQTEDQEPVDCQINGRDRINGKGKGKQLVKCMSCQSEKWFFPEGIDIYFENVGGKLLDAVLQIMRVNGRIAVSGLLSQYNLEQPDGIQNLMYLVFRRIRMQGFVVFDYCSMYPKFLDMVLPYVREEKLVYVEDITEGILHGPAALLATWFLPCWLAMVLEVFGVGDSGDDNWCLAEAVAVVVLCATDGSSGRVGK
ncbi:hypothetical protein LWI28_002412 [Acer negundo]|uniref:Alcohol dehydrogenase-like C-terminal domain-containing protein n=1 Tax=Acer negundo TaxID=4023 RepID=A0AAD5ICM1_ACENE|nr:hypothetical protein LWI28_002412 [Acer negundo]